MINYKVGDVIRYRSFGGDIRTVRVEGKEEDIKNGYPGFFGTDSEGGGVWGYDNQIIALIPGGSKK